MFNSDVVYLDFFNLTTKKFWIQKTVRTHFLKSYISWKSDNFYLFKTASNNSLIINLVSRQYISFWLINLTNKADTKHFQKITIILSGRAKLKYLSEKNDDGFIIILHAPAYDDSKKPGQNYRQKCFTYLKDNFCLSASNVMYTENLCVFCHIYNVKIDLSILFDV